MNALEDLTATISTIRQRIEDYRASMAEDETRTRQLLIDPLLTTLGRTLGSEWVVTDDGIQGQKAEYVLQRDNQPVALVKAESLQKHLDDRYKLQVLNRVLNQVLDYYRKHDIKIKYMAITNGDDWLLYDVRNVHRKSLPYRVYWMLMQLKISANPPRESAEKFSPLWDFEDNITTRPEILKWKPIVTSENGREKRVANKKTDGDADNRNGFALYTEINDKIDDVMNKLDERHVSTYKWLNERLRLCNVSEDIDYQKKYRGYWRMTRFVVSRDSKFSEAYFDYLEQHKHDQDADFLSMCDELGGLTTDSGHSQSSFQFSFITKLAHMIDNTFPIYDSMVRDFYCLQFPVFDSMIRGFARHPVSDIRTKIKKANDIVDFLKVEQKKVLKNGLLSHSINKFRSIHSHSLFSDEKILDSLIWAYISQSKKNIVGMTENKTRTRHPLSNKKFNGDADNQGWIPINDRRVVDEWYRYGGRGACIIFIRFYGKWEGKFSQWTDVVQHIVEITLVEQGKLNPADLPYPDYEKKYFLNNTATHRNGDLFAFTRKLSNGMWLNVQGNMQKLHSNLCFLLGHYHVDFDKVQVKFRAR